MKDAIAAQILVHVMTTVIHLLDVVVVTLATVESNVKVVEMAISKILIVSVLFLSFHFLKTTFKTYSIAPCIYLLQELENQINKEATDQVKQINIRRV